MISKLILLFLKVYEIIISMNKNNPMNNKLYIMNIDHKYLVIFSNAVFKNNIRNNPKKIIIF